MASEENASGTPIPGTAGTERDTRAWARRHAWSIGGAFAVLTLGGFWWRRRRKLRASDIEPVTASWLAEHEYGEGQRGGHE